MRSLWSDSACLAQNAVISLKFCFWLPHGKHVDFFRPGHPSPLSVICAVLLFSKFTQLTSEDTSPADVHEKEVL